MELWPPSLINAIKVVYLNCPDQEAHSKYQTCPDLASGDGHGTLQKKKLTPDEGIVESTTVF